MRCVRAEGLSFVASNIGTFTRHNRGVGGAQNPRGRIGRSADAACNSHALRVSENHSSALNSVIDILEKRAGEKRKEGRSCKLEQHREDNWKNLLSLARNQHP